MQRILYITIILFFAQEAFAQRVQGIVTDALTKQPLAFVSVSMHVKKTDYVMETTSDAAGNYAFENIPQGKYKLYFSLKGYLPFSTRVKIEKDKTVKFDVSLINELAKSKNREITTDMPLLNPGSPMVISELFILQNHPDLYTYKKYSSMQEVDSIIDFKSIEQEHKRSYTIYFDVTKKQAAYISTLRNDSLIIEQYWRSGNMKMKSIRKKNEDGIYSAYSMSLYCENGTRLVTWDVNTPCASVFTEWYCNGNKKSELVRDANCQPILETTWDENGKMIEQKRF